MIYKALGFRGLFYSACQEHTVCAQALLRTRERPNRRNGLSNSRRAVTADLAVCLGSPSHPRLIAGEPQVMSTDVGITKWWDGAQRQAPQGEQRKSQRALPVCTLPRRTHPMWPFECMTIHGSIL